MKPKRILITLALLFTQYAVSEETSAGKRGAEGIERLKKGNEAFLADRGEPRQNTPRRVEVAAGQHPFASILTCADSRVPPETLFSQGLGDLFVIRVAGAISEPATLGSIEYAAEHLHVPLLVVMGHTSCGAVKAAMDSKSPARSANLESILSAIRPALPYAYQDRDAWTSAVYASVEQTVSDVVRNSPLLDRMARAGLVTIVGAVYDIQNGRAHFSKPISLGAPAPVQIQSQGHEAPKPAVAKSAGHGQPEHH